MTNKIPQVNSNFLYNLCSSTKDIFQNFAAHSEVSWKGIDNPVTELDKKIDEIIFKKLCECGFTAEEIISEERATSSTFNKSSHWIIDPIDGTKEFIQGIPEYALSIAYRQNNQFVAAGVYNPRSNFLVVWDAQSGVQMKDEFVLSWNPESILYSRSEWKNGLLRNWNPLYPILPMGSIAYKLALVAAGKARATFSLQPKNSWDIAAGIAMVIGAGGLVTDLSGKEIDFSNPLQRYQDGLLATISRDDHKFFLNELLLQRK